MTNQEAHNNTNSNTPVTPNKEDEDNQKTYQDESNDQDSSQKKESLIIEDDTDSRGSTNITPNKDLSYNLQETRKEKHVQFEARNSTQDLADQESSEEEDEDDDNTIDSNQTSTYRRRDMDKLILPPFTRYQIMISLDKNDPFNMSEEINEEELKPPAQRVRDALISLATQINIYDQEAKIISWKTDPNYTYLDKDNFPEEVAGIATYFQGYKSNIKADRRVYLKVGLHTPNSQELLFSHINTWMSLYGYTFKKCIIQAESAAYIGWLAYSTTFTDTEILRQELIRLSQFEWGFKQVAITNSDKDTKWLQRQKAIGIYVPSKMAEIAKTIIGSLLEAKASSPFDSPDYTDKYIFVRPEKEMLTNKVKQLFYSGMVKRHKTHCNSIHAKLSTDIRVDLDQTFKLKSTGLEISLRDIILDLKVSDKENPLAGTSLFHAVDYVSDSSNLWIDGLPGPGGSSHIFSFYKQTESEAITMINGLGRYIYYRYGKKLATMMFTHDHFRATKGWRYNVITGLFNTPEMRQIKANFQHDNNLRAINILEKLQKEEEIKANKEKKMKAMLNIVSEKNKKLKELQENTKKDKNKEEETVKEDAREHNNNKSDETIESGIAEYVENEQLQEMIQKREDNDLDSLNENTDKCKVSQVEIGNASIASSITDNTNRSDEQSLTDISENTKQSDNTNTSKISISQTILEKIALDDTLKSDEIKQRMKQYQEFQLNKAKQSSEAKIQKVLEIRQKALERKAADSPNKLNTPIDNPNSHNNKKKKSTPSRSSTRLKDIQKKKAASSLNAGSEQ